MIRKKKPKFAKKKIVTANAPVANSGFLNSRASSPAVATAQFDVAEHRSEHDPGGQADDNQGIGPSSCERFDDAEHEECDAEADECSAGPVDGRRLAFPRLGHCQRQRQQQEPRCGDDPEDRLPLPHVKQCTGHEQPHHCGEPGNAGPDADGLGALLFWIDDGQQRQRRRHHERSAHSRHRTPDDQSMGPSSQMGANEAKVKMTSPMSNALRRP